MVFAPRKKCKRQEILSFLKLNNSPFRLWMEWLYLNVLWLLWSPHLWSTSIELRKRGLEFGGGEVGNKFTRNFSNCYFEFLTARVNLDKLLSQRKIGKKRQVDDKCWLQRPKVRSEMGREYNSTVSSSSCPFPLVRRRDRGSGEENTQCQLGVEIRIQQQGKNLWWSFCVILSPYKYETYHPSVVTETVWERRPNRIPSPSFSSGVTD